MKELADTAQADVPSERKSERQGSTRLMVSRTETAQRYQRSAVELILDG